MGKGRKEIQYTAGNSKNEKNNGSSFLPYFIFLYSPLEVSLDFFVLCEFLSPDCNIYKKERDNSFVYILICRNDLLETMNFQGRLSAKKRKELEV